MNMKRSLDLYRFRTLAVFWARSATAAMTFASIAFGLILSVGTAFAAVDGFDAKGLPFAHEGFGVRRNFYQSGRLSAKVADIAGIFELNYVGRQPFTRQRAFSSAAENCAWTHQFTPYALVGDRPYRLTFADTVHYPFGYRSVCTLDGVTLRHELVLDRNVAFRRVTVVANPLKKPVRIGVAHMKDTFLMGDRLAMFPWRTTAHLADGNQYGSYYPVTDRTYWNAMNAAGRADAIADFRNIDGEVPDGEVSGGALHVCGCRDWRDGIEPRYVPAGAGSSLEEARSCLLGLRLQRRW